ncbi:MAG: cytochrome c [Akkermansiaceae bacterium]
MENGLIFALLLIGRHLQAEQNGATLFAEKCASCHGPKAEGDRKQQTPSLASLPNWYLTK